MSETGTSGMERGDGGDAVAGSCCARAGLIIRDARVGAPCATGRSCFHSASTGPLNAIPRDPRTRRSSLYNGLLGDGACRARTGDLLLAKQALSQLS